MTRRKLTFLLVVTMGIVGVIWLSNPSEPAYEGKRLSVWLDDQRMVDGRIELSEQSIRAVQAISTNAIPHLLNMLRCSDSKAKLWVVQRLWRYSVVREHVPLAGAKRQRAILGFRALGLNASSAIPELVNLVLNSPDDTGAINALTSSGEDAIESFAEAVSSPDPEVRKRAVFALGCLRQAPDVALPALGKALSDSDAEVRAVAVGALGPYQERARPMISQITSLLTDTNPRVRVCATEALAMIEAKPLNSESQ